MASPPCMLARCPYPLHSIYTYAPLELIMIEAGASRGVVQAPSPVPLQTPSPVPPVRAQPVPSYRLRALSLYRGFHRRRGGCCEQCTGDNDHGTLGSQTSARLCDMLNPHAADESAPVRAQPVPGSLYRFLSLSLYRFLSLSLYRFLSLARETPPARLRSIAGRAPWPAWAGACLRTS